MLPSNANTPPKSSSGWNPQLGEVGNSTAITNTTTRFAHAENCSTLEADAANTLATLFRGASSNSGSGDGGSGDSCGSGTRGSIRGSGGSGPAAVADRYNAPVPYPGSSGISFAGTNAGFNSNPDYHRSCLISAAYGNQYSHPHIAPSRTSGQHLLWRIC